MIGNERGEAVSRREPRSSFARGARAVVVAGAILGASGCTDLAGYDLDMFWGYIPFLSTMRTSVAIDAHVMPRLPAEHTIPVASPNGDAPPPFGQTQLDSVGAALTNPYAGQASPVVMSRGELMYERQCTVCHGAQGEGNGPAVGPGKYPFAPPLNGAATAARSDGYIYAVITAGRGLMPPYGHAITHEDRWAIVNYVRHLQAQAGTGAPPAGVVGTGANAAPVPPSTPDAAAESVPDGDQP